MPFSMKYGSTNSKYCYPGKDILINKLDIRDDKLLQNIESDYSHIRLLELDAKPVEGNFDLTHLQNIHFYIFQDIYDFAGKIREEEISKGSTRFASCKFIFSYAKDMLDKLKSENLLVGTNIDTFSQRTAYYMSELNILHPFREGNGRSIREFIRCLGLNAGYVINWDLVSKEEVLAASIESVLNTASLCDCIRKTINT